MERRKFIGDSLKTLATTSFFVNNTFSFFSKKENFKDLIIGHNSHQYKIDMNWGALDANFYPVNDCHEMVQDSQGRIILLTNHTKNNIIIYDKSVQLIEVWGTDFPGAHGLTLNVENGEDFLYISDNNRHEVIKTTIDGKVVLILPFPKDAPQYEKPEQYIPTETAVTPNGDIYVADGYGSQYICIIMLKVHCKISLEDVEKEMNISTMRMAFVMMIEIHSILVCSSLHDNGMN